jgi:hypothetical protein
MIKEEVDLETNIEDQGQGLDIKEISIDIDQGIDIMIEEVIVEKEDINIIMIIGDMKIKGIDELN